MKRMSECLEEAANLLQETDWIQHHFNNIIWDTDKKKMTPPTAYCMIGACKAVCPDRDFAEGSLGFALALDFPDTSSAFAWNDAPTATKRAVIAQLRASAARQRREGR